MKIKATLNPGSYWAIITSKVNALPYVRQNRRTALYSQKLIREYHMDTYRSCPAWLQGPLERIIAEVKAEFLAKGISV